MSEVNVSPVSLPGVSWSLNFAAHQEVFPAGALAQAYDLLDRWAAVYPRGNTWVGRTYEVPSLIARLDCMVDEKGVLRVYEVEDRPCGIGVTSHLVPAFREALAALQKEWPAFRWVKAPNRPTDDVLWLGEGLSLEEAKRTDELLLVRSRPEDTEFHVLEPRAVSTVQHEGDKLCAAQESVGLYNVLQWIVDPTEQSGGYIEGLPSGPIVVKPTQGTRAREVRVYLNGSAPSGLVVNKKERLSFGDLERQVKKSGRVICQPLIPPMLRDHLPGKNMIYRMFFGYSPLQRKYIPLHGVWMALPALIVHGTDEAISGPLVCE